jgi:hypothetical protein
MKNLLFFKKALIWIALVFVVGCSSSSSDSTASATSWSFGVMSDTQWTIATDPAGTNPNGVSVSIANQINQQFITKGVKFVIQVGDLTENGNDADIAARATAAQALYNAGIGFFPMRGNHETYAAPANGYGIAAFQTNFPQTQGASKTFGAINFSSPTSISADLTGMSYSFDYGPAGSNVRMVIIDDWATPSKRVDAAGYAYGYSIADQQTWISSRLNSASRGTTHAFVFSHQNLIGENHQDCLFNGYTNANPDMQNAFFASLQSNNVKIYFSGHDHVHQRSIIASPDGLSKVQEIIGASDSSKFYTPKVATDPNWFGQKTRETPIRQDLFTPGFYIFTVSGPRVTVDYYADATGGFKSDALYPGTPGSTLAVTPVLNFVKKETFGYSLNGKEFQVAQNQAYTTVQDSYSGTTAKILSGTNASTATDYIGRNLINDVYTGWSPRYGDIASNILSIWGMAGTMGSDQTDTYTLSMTYSGQPATTGAFGLVIRDNNQWVLAVDKNVGGSKRFVAGPWDASYGLGTYGVDTATSTVWAVINKNGDFAAAYEKTTAAALTPIAMASAWFMVIPGIVGGFALLRRRRRS